MTPSEAGSRLAYLLTILWLCVVGSPLAKAQEVVSRPFPGHSNLTLVYWSVPAEGAGHASAIAVVQVAAQNHLMRLWQSEVDFSHSPQVQFLPQIEPDGVPVALVERQTGAASSQLDIIGESGGHFMRLLQLDGFEFQVRRFSGDKLPSIVAHTDASVLDVPHIYGWNGSRFIDRSTSHAKYYRELLAKDQRALPPDTSGAVLLNLSNIAVLVGDVATAREILERALSTERSRGSSADQELIQNIERDMHALPRS